MLAQYLEILQSDRDANNNVTIDVSNYDYCLVQPIGNSVTLSSTINGGAIQGVSDGSAISAGNFANAAGTLITNGTTITNTVPDGEIVRLGVVGRYVRINMGNSVSKIFVMLAKIS